MANIKIAQLTNALTISDTDLVIVESATQTMKMTYGALKESIIGDIKNPKIEASTPISEISGVTTDPSYIPGGIFKVYKLSNGDKILDVQLFISYSILSNGVIGTLPPEYRPLVKASKIVYDFVNDRYLRLLIGASGSIEVVTPSYGSTSSIPSGKISETIRFA